MAIRFEGGASLKIGSVLRDMSLTIKGQRLVASGVVVAKRAENQGSESVHAIMFDPNSLDNAKRDKLKTLVLKINQSAMELTLERA
jgi:hypothetical protein